MASDGRRSPNTFNSKEDSESRSAREAFRTAKDRNGIARCQSPKEHPTKLPDRNNPKQHVTEYKFNNVHGEEISIRKDNPVDYKDGGPKQGPHYNAGPTDEKLKQHHNYTDTKKK